MLAGLLVLRAHAMQQTRMISARYASEFAFRQYLHCHPRHPALVPRLSGTASVTNELHRSRHPTVPYNVRNDFVKLLSTAGVSSDSSSTTAAEAQPTAIEQALPPLADTQQGDSCQPEPPSSGSHASSWPAFLEQLWHQGYFEEHSSTHGMSSAISSRRDIKKALQQLGRSRTDIVLQLPQDLLKALATIRFPERMERKALLGLQRLQADLGTAQGAAMGQAAPAAAPAAAVKPVDAWRVSTQDVLRVLWVLADICSEAESSSVLDGSSDAAAVAAAPAVAAGDAESAGVLGRLLQLVLDLEQQEPDASLVQAAAKAAATPNLAAYEQHQAARKADREAATAAAAARTDRDISSSSGRESRNSRDRNQGSKDNDARKPVLPYPTSDDPYVMHKLRLLKAAPWMKSPMRQGDWFCENCGAHNFRTKQTCYRCEVPGNSLGNSSVTTNDLQQLQQLQLDSVEYEQCHAAAAYAAQLAQAYASAAAEEPRLSLIAAAKRASIGPFEPTDEAAPQSRGMSRGRSDRSAAPGASRRERLPSAWQEQDRPPRREWQQRQQQDGRSRRDSSSSGSRRRFADDRDGRFGGREDGFVRADSADEDFAENGGERSQSERPTTSSFRSSSSSNRQRSAAIRSRSSLAEPSAAAESVVSLGSSSSSSSSSSISSVSLRDAFKEAIAGLQTDSALEAPALPPLQQQQRQRQQQQAPASPQEEQGPSSSVQLGWSRVRRIQRQQRQQPEDDSPAAAAPEADDDSSSKADRYGEGSSSRSSSSSAERRSRRADLRDADDEGDLAGWAADYSSAGPAERVPQRQAQQQLPEEKEEEGWRDSRRGRDSSRRSSSSFSRDRGDRGYNRRQGLDGEGQDRWGHQRDRPSRGSSYGRERPSSQDREGFGGSRRGGGSSSRFDRVQSRKKSQDEGKPSWASIFDE